MKAYRPSGRRHFSAILTPKTVLSGVQASESTSSANANLPVRNVIVWIGFAVRLSRNPSKTNNASGASVSRCTMT